MSISILLLIAIFLISFVLTMVGLGGGLIFSPLFVILGFAKSEAASASLFLNLIAAASAAFTYGRKKMVDFSLSIPLIITSALAAPFGSYLNLQIDIRLFLIVMSVVLIAAAIRMMVSPKQENGAEQDSVDRTRKIVGGLIIGAGIGALGGLLGIGGGVFVVPLLIYGLKTPTRIAAASSTFIVCFSSLTGFLGYASMETIDWRFVLPAAVASFVGGQAGSLLMSQKMKGGTIRIVFGIVLLLFSAKLLHKAFG
jgi:hypothetical protein